MKDEKSISKDLQIINNEIKDLNNIDKEYIKKVEDENKELKIYNESLLN